MSGKERFYRTAQRLAPFVLAGLMLPSSATAESPRPTYYAPPLKSPHTLHTRQLRNQEKPVLVLQGQALQARQGQWVESTPFIPQDFTPYSFSRTNEGFFVLVFFKNRGFHLLKNANSNQESLFTYIREHPVEYLSFGNMANIAQSQENPNIMAAIGGTWKYYPDTYFSYSKDNGRTWKETRFIDVMSRVQISKNGEFVFLLPSNYNTKSSNIKRFNLVTGQVDRDYEFPMPDSAGIFGAITPPRKLADGSYEAYARTWSGFARLIFVNKEHNYFYTKERLITEFYDVCEYCDHIYSFSEKPDEQKVWIVANPGMTEIREYKKGQLARAIKPDLNLYRNLRSYSVTQNFLYFEDLLVDEEGNRAFVVGNLNGKQDVIEVIEIDGTSHRLIEIRGAFLDNVDNGFIIDKLALVKRGNKTLLQAFVESNTQDGKGTGIWELDITQGYENKWRKIPTLAYRNTLAHVQR